MAHGVMSLPDPWIRRHAFRLLGQKTRFPAIGTEDRTVVNGQMGGWVVSSPTSGGWILPLARAVISVEHLQQNKTATTGEDGVLDAAD